MGSSKPLAGVSVEVFIEQEKILPVWRCREGRLCRQSRPGPILWTIEAHEPFGQKVGDFLECYLSAV